MKVGTGDTKATILEAATDLFAAYGFGGASIRQIAARSNVNVASIHYHFGNKQNLYWAVMIETRDSLDRGFAELARKSVSVEELTLLAFDFLMTRKATLRTALKLMMSEGVLAPDEQFAEIIQSDPGPPGVAHFSRALSRKVMSQVSPEVLRRGAMSILSGLFHWSMICSSMGSAYAQFRMPSLDEEEIKQQLRFLVEAVVRHVVRLEANKSICAENIWCVEEGPKGP